MVFSCFECLKGCGQADTVNRGSLLLTISVLKMFLNDFYHLKKKKIKEPINILIRLTTEAPGHLAPLIHVRY